MHNCFKHTSIARYKNGSLLRDISMSACREVMQQPAALRKGGSGVEAVKTGLLKSSMANAGLLPL